MEAPRPQITQNLIDTLVTNQYTRWMQELRRTPPDFLTRLQFARRHLPAELAALVVTQIERRERGARKFAMAKQMFFTAEGLEQATGEAIANYRASCFPDGVPIFDACCGVGGDALALAKRGRVFAVDADFETALCARINTTLCLPPESRPVSVLCADVTKLDLARLAASGIEAAFFDPSRRGGRQNQNRHRVRSAEDYAPPLAFTNELRRYFSFVAVKVSPAIDDETLFSYPDAAIEFISQNGECKECLLWFEALTPQPPLPSLGEGESMPLLANSLSQTWKREEASRDLFSPLSQNWERGAGGVRASGERAYTAIVLRSEAPPAVLRPFDCEPLLTDGPRDWLIEPDSAVIRAHLLAQIGGEFGAALLDRRFAYLTADRFAPTPFATGYRIIEALPYHLKNVQARLLTLKRRVTAIKKRGVEIDPADLRKRLPGDKNSADTAILILTRQGEKITALICEPPFQSMTE